VLILPHNFLNVGNAATLIQFINLSSVLSIHYVLYQFSLFLYSLSTSSGIAIFLLLISKILLFNLIGVNVSLNKLFAINPQGSALAF